MRIIRSLSSQFELKAYFPYFNLSTRPNLASDLETIWDRGCFRTIPAGNSSKSHNSERMIMYSEFEQNVAVIRERVATACADHGRSVESVSILPVTKTHPVDAALFAAQAGFVAVGENRVQEVLEKQPQATDVTLDWELIGHLQSNKAKTAVEHCARIQTVDSEKLLRRIDRLAVELGKRQRILIQVNAGEDPNKHGILCSEAPAILEIALGLEHISVEGLMTIAPLDEDLDVARACFDQLRITRDALAVQFGIPLNELPMGMTGDLEHAIAAGSTQIRVGSALYGKRG